MANKIGEDAARLITAMFKHGENYPEHFEPWMEGKDLFQATGLKPSEINDAVEFLTDRGLIERMNFLNTAPYHFGQVMLNSQGRFIYHEMVSATTTPMQPTTATPSGSTVNTPPLPIGSPFGFTDLDWEYVQLKKRDRTKLFVVMGFQFASSFYNTDKLKQNVSDSFQNAVNKFNQRGGRDQIVLDFKPLAAGYGEHLFNQIARDIISADIAVFETSDMNSNVMIEMGVALTWGSRVFPIKKIKCPKPPSDISGQTWADYLEDGTGFTNANHEEDLVAMIQRAVQKKSI